MVDVHVWFPTIRIFGPFVKTPVPISRPSEGVLIVPNKDAEISQRFDANARPRDLKFGAHGTRPSSTVAEAGQPLTHEASDFEDDWLGREQAWGLKQRLK